MTNQENFRRDTILRYRQFKSNTARKTSWRNGGYSPVTSSTTILAYPRLGLKSNGKKAIDPFSHPISLSLFLSFFLSFFLSLSPRLSFLLPFIYSSHDDNDHFVQMTLPWLFLLVLHYDSRSPLNIFFRRFTPHSAFRTLYATYNTYAYVYVCPNLEMIKSPSYILKNRNNNHFIPKNRIE